MWWAITCDQMTTIIIHDPFRLTSSESQTVSESHRICVYTCASDINKKTEHTAGRRLLRSPGQAGSQAAMKRWFSSSLCEVAHALEETEDEKKSIHNTTLRIQHKHLNLRPSPQVCCDPEMTIFLYCSLISIERIRPTQNWLCVHKLEITIDFFPSSFQKTGTLWHWQICLPCLLRWGYPEAFWEVRNAVICLIAHLMLEQEPKKKGTNAKEWIRRALGPAISRDQPLYGEPILLPRVLMLISDNSWWDSTVSWLLLSLERGASRCAAGRRADHRSCDIIWGQMWRISDSHSFHWSLPLQFSLVPSWDLGGLQLINGSQIALLTWQMKHLHWRECLDN